MKKGYKVTDVNREKKVGVAAETLAELIEKSSRKLGVAHGGRGDSPVQLYVAADGTAVEDDEYLATLPPQTVLVLLAPQQIMLTDAEHAYALVRGASADLLRAGRAAGDFMGEHEHARLRALHAHVALARADDAGAALSGRDQHPEWFQGLDPSERTKEGAMKKRAKDRMRGYLYKTKSALQSSPTYVHSKNTASKTLIDAFIGDVRRLLEQDKYNGSYFDRSAAESQRLCSERGEFSCGGAWDFPRCAYPEHATNPYRSREERIVFQTWNLDHQVELSRSVIPAVVAAAERARAGRARCGVCRKARASRVAADQYYRLIFTRHNLRLVHIVCHDKAKHALSADEHVLCHECYVTSLTPK